MPSDDPSQLATISPFFIVGDLARAVVFYVDRLGFEVRVSEPPEDPFFAIVGRDRVQILLKEVDDEVAPQPNPSRHPWAAWDAFVFVADPDGLLADLVARGVSPHRGLTLRDDGLRGFEIRDADGYVLFFGCPA